MSLLNKMLNDLEKRQAAEGTRALPQSAHTLPTARSNNMGLLALIGLIILSIATGGWLWITRPKTASNAVAPLSSSIPTSTKAPPPTAQPVTNQSPTTTVAISNTTATHTASGIKASSTIATELLATSSDTRQHTTKPNQTVVQKMNAPQSKLAESDITSKVAMTSPPKISTGNGSASHPAHNAFKVVTPHQQSDNLYQQAISLSQQSRGIEAQRSLKEALRLNPTHYNARLLLVALLVESNNRTEAMTLLREGLDLSPERTDFSLALAQLQAAGGAGEEAIMTLKTGLSSAGDDANYHALLAALLQKKGLHLEAIPHFITALRSNPTMPSWLIGIGISLLSENKNNDAEEAFQRAVDTGELSPEVEQFANARLKQIRQQRLSVAH